jgi:hypothetical protein
MRQIAFAALVLTGLSGAALADAAPQNSDIIEQNGVLIFYPPGTAEAAAAVAENDRPVVINKAMAVQNVVVQVRRGWSTGWRAWQAYPCFCREYSGPRYPF